MIIEPILAKVIKNSIGIVPSFLKFTKADLYIGIPYKSTVKIVNASITK